MQTTGAIPSGSTVLVTGANGHLGSHIANELLKAGYKVRGTARSAGRIATMKAKWDAEFPGQFEAVIVPDMELEGAYDAGMQGCSAVAHVASVMTFDSDYKKVIDPVVAATLAVLRSAAKVPSIKRFVLTSSSCAATMPKPNVKFSMDESTWNEESSILARGPINAMSAWSVYGASKAEGERAAWDFMKSEKRSFVLNTILPNANFGLILDPSVSASTSDWPRSLYSSGSTDAVKDVSPQWFVNPQDTALLHLAALTFPSIVDARVWAVSAPFNWNDILASLRRVAPDHPFPADFAHQDHDLSEIDNKRGEEILHALGRPGWRTLDESMKEIVASFH